ncbi:MAG: hypothetical protein KDB37_21040 [Ilumatobacter sp.]|nr:hypothetical protein [Ilumatobacter sp.]
MIEATSSEIDETTDDGPGDSAGSTARRARSIGVGLLGVAAILCLVGGLLGAWTVRTATNTERFENRVEVLLQDEEISDALAARVVTEVAEGIGIRDAIDEAMPEVLQPAVDLLLAGVRSRVEDRLAELVRTPEVAEGVAVVAGRAHETAVAVLEGDDVVDGVDVSDGEVRINLLPLTTRALGLLQDEFGLFGDVELPDIDRSGDPAEQRAALEAAFGRDLPDEFGTPVVFESDRLDEVGTEVQTLRDLFTLAQRVYWFLLIAGLALVGVSIWLSTSRWRSAAYLVAGLFGAALVFRIVGGEASDRLPDVVQSPGAQATVRNVADALVDDLNETLMLCAILALMAFVAVAVVLIGAPFAGRASIGEESAAVDDADAVL